MKRSMLAVLLVALLVPAAQSLGQNKLVPFFGGGLAKGVGDLSDGTDAGWVAFGGIDCPVESKPGLNVGASILYAHVPYSGSVGDATNIPGIFADLGYLIGATSSSRIKPYVRAGVGFVQHRYDPGNSNFDSESETKFGLNAGGGLSMAFGGVGGFAGVHTLQASGTSLVTVYAGLSFPGRPPTR